MNIHMKFTDDRCSCIMLLHLEDIQDGCHSSHLEWMQGRWYHSMAVAPSRDPVGQCRQFFYPSIVRKGAFQFVGYMVEYDHASASSCGKEVGDIGRTHQPLLAWGGGGATWGGGVADMAIL